MGYDRNEDSHAEPGVSKKFPFTVFNKTAVDGRPLFDLLMDYYPRTAYAVVDQKSIDILIF